MSRTQNVAYAMVREAIRLYYKETGLLSTRVGLDIFSSRYFAYTRDYGETYLHQELTIISLDSPDRLVHIEQYPIEVVGAFFEPVTYNWRTHLIHCRYTLGSQEVLCDRGHAQHEESCRFYSIWWPSFSTNMIPYSCSWGSEMPSVDEVLYKKRRVEQEVPIHHGYV